MTEPLLPSDYQSFLGSLKERIQQAQLKAIVSVNEQLITLYWQVGKAILERQQKAGWGAGVIEQLSRDLRDVFPEMKGFSPRNLGYMKSFAQAYPDEAILQAPLAKITWYHHITLLDKVKDETERLWYARATIENGWSRNVLVHQIELKLYERSGKATTNFSGALPAPQSELAHATLKDPYIFDFISLRKKAEERDVQKALLANIQKTLLELGVGFTFVGSNYHLVVGNKDYYIDLLFYHIRLRCFVVVELKIDEFRPAHAGQIGFYITAIDEQVKHPDDNPTIGIILVKEKEKTTVEYALQKMTGPVGVAAYEYTTKLPEDVQNLLPDVSQLEASIERIDKYDLHPVIDGGQLKNYLLYIYDGDEGQKFWETGILPDGQNIHDVIPNIDNILDIDTSEAKHRRKWAHKFSIELKRTS
jgi:predicted nuclease of restriction endonuclease-like (RecB) superfamily